MVQSYEKSSSDMETCMKNKFYRKLRSIAVNFMLDAADIDAECISMVSLCAVP